MTPLYRNVILSYIQMKRGIGLEKKFSFYLTIQTAQRIDEMQQLISTKQGRVTKAYLVNSAINEYYEKHIAELKDEPSND